MSLWTWPSGSTRASSIHSMTRSRSSCWTSLRKFSPSWMKSSNSTRTWTCFSGPTTSMIKQSNQDSKWSRRRRSQRKIPFSPTTCAKAQTASNISRPNKATKSARPRLKKKVSMKAPDRAYPNSPLKWTPKWPLDQIEATKANRSSSRTQNREE